VGLGPPLEAAVQAILPKLLLQLWICTSQTVSWPPKSIGWTVRFVPRSNPHQYSPASLACRPRDR
jgi:hypothetical protein